MESIGGIIGDKAEEILSVGSCDIACMAETLGYVGKFDLQTFLLKRLDKKFIFIFCVCS